MSLRLIGWVSGLLERFERNPQSTLLVLLTLCYGQPLEVVLQARWGDFDLQERVWRFGSDCLPLTGPILDLLARFRSTASGRGEHMFTGRCGGELSKALALRLVSQLSGGVLPFATLQAWAQKGCPDLASGDLRAEILREYAGRGASATQVVCLKCELEARLRASVEAWHDVLLVRRTFDEPPG